MSRRDPSFTFARTPGVYFPPKRRSWGRFWLRIAIIVGFGISLFWLFFVHGVTS